MLKEKIVGRTFAIQNMCYFVMYWFFGYSHKIFSSREKVAAFCKETFLCCDEPVTTHNYSLLFEIPLNKQHFLYLIRSK